MNKKNATVVLPEPTIARRSMSKNRENWVTSVDFRRTSALILADCLVGQGLFVEARKLKVSLTDAPIFRGFVIGEASGDGRPVSADSRPTF